MRIAVVGAGISGLAAAFDLARDGIAVEVFEATARCGGNVRSSWRDGFLIEHGADSWIAQKPWLEELARDLGMQDEIVASPAISPSTAILRAGELIPLPPGLRLFVPSDLNATDASPLFSAETKQRFHAELANPPAPATQEESVAAFVARHFGDEVVDVLAAPLLAGVYGGDAARLSAAAVVPGLVELERQHVSLIKGVQQQPRSAAPEGIFRTLRRGMQSIIDAMASRLPPDAIHFSTHVLRLLPKRDGYSLVTTRGSFGDFTHVILAVPVPKIADILSIELPAIRYSSAATVAFAYDALELPPGFGFLVASGERCDIMAATLVHQKWPFRVPPGKSILRAFVSDPKLLAAPDGPLVLAAHDAMRQIFAIKIEPSFAVVDRWPNSMPQYEVGHHERVAEIRRRVAAFDNISLAGNAYDGVGLPDAVRSGRAAAQAIHRTKGANTV